MLTDEEIAKPAFGRHRISEENGSVVEYMRKRKKKKRIDYFSLLPNELIFLILEFVPLYQLPELGRVNQRFYKLCTDNLLWNYRFHQIVSSLYPANYIPKRRKNSVNTLKFIESKIRGYQHVRHMHQSLHSVKQFIFSQKLISSSSSSSLLTKISPSNSPIPSPSSSPLSLSPSSPSSVFLAFSPGKSSPPIIGKALIPSPPFTTMWERQYELQKRVKDYENDDVNIENEINFEEQGEKSQSQTQNEINGFIEAMVEKKKVREVTFQRATKSSEPFFNENRNLLLKKAKEENLSLSSSSSSPTLSSLSTSPSTSSLPSPSLSSSLPKTQRNDVKNEEKSEVTKYDQSNVEEKEKQSIPSNDPPKRFIPSTGMKQQQHRINFSRSISNNNNNNNINDNINSNNNNNNNINNSENNANHESPTKQLSNNNNINNTNTNNSNSNNNNSNSNNSSNINNIINNNSNSSNISSSINNSINNTAMPNLEMYQVRRIPSKEAYARSGNYHKSYSIGLKYNEVEKKDIFEKNSVKEEVKLHNLLGDKGTSLLLLCNQYNEDVNIWDENCEGNLLWAERRECNSKVVRAGSLNKLIEFLTSVNDLDLQFVKAFLMTFESFTTVEILFIKLMQRFRVPPKTQEGYVSEDEWRKSFVQPVRYRVVNIIKMLIDKHVERVCHNSWIMERLAVLIGITLPVCGFSMLATQLAQLLNKKIEEYERKEDLVEELSELKRVSPNFSWTPFSADLIASQLTILDHLTYRAIKPSEMLNKKWLESNKTFHSPHLVKLLKRFNSLSYWVVSEVLLFAEPKERSVYIEHFIEISQQLLKYNNFLSLTAVLSALHSFPISRLKRTWSLVSREMTDLFLKLGDIVNPHCSYKNYKQSIHAAEPPCVPFIGAYLMDLDFLEDSRDPSGLIQFSRRQRIYEVISNALMYQSPCYQTIERHSQLYNYLYHLPQDKTEDELSARSLALEPRLDA